MMTTGATAFVGLGSDARRAFVISPEIYFQSVFAMLPRWFGIVLLSSDINMCHWHTVRPRARVVPRGIRMQTVCFLWTFSEACAMLCQFMSETGKACASLCQA